MSIMQFKGQKVHTDCDWLKSNEVTLFSVELFKFEGGKTLTKNEINSTKELWSSADANFTRNLVRVEPS